MTRIAFAFPEDPRWSGGVNYLYNLLFALSTLKDGTLEPVLFAGNQIDQSLLCRFQELAQVVQNPLLNRTSALWKIRRGLARLTGQDVFLGRLFAAHRIDVASHCNIAGQFLPFKTINWIPDFQHMHLPNLFPEADICLRNKKYANLIKNSDCIVLSSKNAYEDLQKFSPRNSVKTHILHFVSQPNKKIYEYDNCDDVCKKYGLPGKFFYMPNQFWAHKNHKVVFDAISHLKKHGLDIYVVCSGATEDLKNKEYFMQIIKYIKSCDIGSNVFILGLIDYSDVMTLFRHSVSVINPSLFEGWSSTVEEAKSIGKNTIISDIPVHREQAPRSSIYFDPNDSLALSIILSEKWKVSMGGPDFELERDARNQLSRRTREFAESYLVALRDSFGILD